MKSLRLLLLVSVVALGAPLFAQVTGPVYPAPGGNNFAGSGSPIDAGGKTGNYSNFDPAAYGQLWWGESFIDNVCSGTCTNPGLMQFNGYDQTTGVATWLSTSNWDFTSGLSGPESVQTEFVLQFAPGTAVLVSPAGFPGNPDLVMPVTGDFSVTYEYELASNGEAVNQFFNSVNGGSSGTSTCPDLSLANFCTSNNAGFWSTAPTPEPSSVLLMGTGFLGLAGLFRRRIFGV